MSKNREDSITDHILDSVDALVSIFLGFVKSYGTFLAIFATIIYLFKKYIMPIVFFALFSYLFLEIYQWVMEVMNIPEIYIIPRKIWVFGCFIVWSIYRHK